jgi:hypothetical protein
VLNTLYKVSKVLNPKCILISIASVDAGVSRHLSELVHEFPPELNMSIRFEAFENGTRTNRWHTSELFFLGHVG